MSRFRATSPEKVAGALADGLAMVAAGELDLPVTVVGSLAGAGEVHDLLATGPGCGQVRRRDRRLMRAAWYDRTGPAAEVLTACELGDPEPGPGQVRVRVHAAGLNPRDVKRREGPGDRVMTDPRVIPGGTTGRG
jgi:hypothetical protein